PAWDSWQEIDFGRRVLETAREEAARPFPPYSDALYMETLEQQDLVPLAHAMGATPMRRPLSSSSRANFCITARRRFAHDHR
ncbi:MAG: hypothetical protein ABI222_09120, partial [Opitutaceae bacterium]